MRSRGRRGKTERGTVRGRGLWMIKGNKEKRIFG